MPLRTVLRPSREGLRLLLAGLLAGSALLAPWPGEGSYTPPLTVGYQVAHADGPNDWPFHWKGWPMFGHDPAHTGYNPEETQLKPPLRLKWSFKTGDRIFSAPAVADGVVYLGSWDGKLYALDAATGTLRWSYTIGDLVGSSPAVAQGVVYVGSHNGKVYALAASSGSLIWSYDASWMWVISSPAVVNGVVYVGTGDNKVHALEATSGGLKWSYSMAYATASSPAVVNGVVYIGSWDKKVYALDATTGALKWSYTTGGSVASPAVANGVVYVGSADGKIYALDAATGAARWSYAMEGENRSSPAVVNGVVYAASEGNKVYALDAATGVLRWSSAGGGAYSSPVVANGVVYVGDGRLYALDAATGALRSSYDVAGPSFSAVSNGVLYVGSTDKKVYAFESQPPPVAVQSLAPYQGATAFFPLSWTVPITWTGVAVASYDVQYRDGSSGAWTDLITATTTLSTTFSGQDGHTYSFRARSRTATGSLGDWSDPVSTTVDLTPPTGSLAAQGWASNLQAMTVTLVPSPSDATSGVGHMQFSTDGATYSDWEAYAASRAYTLSAGANMVYARFKDNAGNISQPVSATVPLDATPPSGSMSVEGWGSNYVTTSVTLRLSAADTQSGLSHTQLGTDAVAYSDWEAYATSRAYSLPAGATTVYARFKDNAGNISQPVSATVTLDLTPPSGSLVLNGGAAYTKDRQVTAGLSASDDLSGLSQVSFSNDGVTYSDWQGYASLSTLSLPAGDGQKTLYARFRDAAGNVSPAYSDTITLDTTPPTTPAPDDGLTGSISSPTVTLQWPAASDALSGVERYYYKTDCGSETATSALSAATPTLPDGDHTFLVRAKDQAGNYSPYGKHAFTIKATALLSPDLFAPDSPTDRERINVSGFGPPAMPIRLYLNCAYYGENQSGNYGAWQFQDVPLALGENVIVASIVDSGGGLSPISMPAVVVRLKTYSTPPAQATASLLTPSGGTVATGSYKVEVPAGALPGAAQVVVTPYGTEGAPPLVGKRSVGAFASITARERGTGAPAQLQKAVRITLGYDPQALGGVYPDQLSVHYYDPDTFTWVALPSQVDTPNRRVTAETSHFSDFALLADLPPMPVKVYLPLVARAAGGW